MKKFGGWLSDKLAELDMTAADLARESGMDTGVISNLIKNKRKPAVESCQLIASGLCIPIEEVYRAADYLPAQPEVDPIIENVVHLMYKLETDERKGILEYVRLRHRLTNGK